MKRVLIANRGEIAVRVVRACREAGIESVAVYSDADRNALHVEAADEAVAIGPPPATESYLVADKIIEACKQTGAEAVHPGYGFLSERESFPRQLADNGIVIVDPDGLSDIERKWLDQRFLDQILPVVTPIAIDPAHPFPFIPNRGFVMAVQLRRRDDEENSVGAFDTRGTRPSSSTHRGGSHVAASRVRGRGLLPVRIGGRAAPQLDGGRVLHRDRAAG